MNLQYRLAKNQDIPTLKELWGLSFGDEGAYCDNFFTKHPLNWIYVAEEAQEICAMTAYFPGDFHLGEESYTSAYLYGVATLPAYRGRGISSRLLRHIYQDLQEQGYETVTTVPAEPSLHTFFGRNGFRDYFLEYRTETWTAGAGVSVKRISPAIYEQKRREARDTAIPSLQHHSSGYDYQSSVCDLGAGGLYLGERGDETAILVLEEGTTGHFVVKEYLGEGALWEGMLSFLWEEKGMCSLSLRSAKPLSSHWEPYEFGMLQWLREEPAGWSWEERGFLGLAFD